MFNKEVKEFLEKRGLKDVVLFGVEVIYIYFSFGPFNFNFIWHICVFFFNSLRHTCVFYRQQFICLRMAIPYIWWRTLVHRVHWLTVCSLSSVCVKWAVWWPLTSPLYFSCSATKITSISKKCKLSSKKKRPTRVSCSEQAPFDLEVSLITITYCRIYSLVYLIFSYYYPCVS